ncbi:hypothetical protein CYMTET_27394 [Cymbomonas tetramitiformis]|uniref:Uncharacterized protein n=1 Tax=Cymbomonas tetramitiformis TaxID=36881 RepID=A0AAE0FPV9_9CHLO|nr:hypothetical protein CYMTET_27394 [Cymbomonas tetramitiformis]
MCHVLTVEVGRCWCLPPSVMCHVFTVEVGRCATSSPWRFGNLVTMEWWTDLWLNEGFATWVGWRAVHELFPDWGVWEQFVVDEQGRGLNLDSLKSSHPIEVEIANSSQVFEIFDAISYSKGSCVIRMLDAFLGENTMREGLRLYIKRHQYQNASTKDLWGALEEVSGKPVKSLMNCWTQQTGYPVVSVSKGEGSQIAISQQRFLGTGPDAEDRTTWMVPLRATAEGGAAVGDVLEGQAQELALGDAAWVKLNSGQSGFYRVSYDPQLLLGLAAALPQLSVADRVGIVGDAFALASAGYSSSAKALALLQHYHAEDSYVVWSEIASGMSSLMSTWYEGPPEVLQGLEKFAASLYAPVALKLGWDPQPAPGTSRWQALRTLGKTLASEQLSAGRRAPHRNSSHVLCWRGDESKAGLVQHVLC